MARRGTRSDGVGAQAHAYVAVDVAVLTVAEGRLEVLLVKVRQGPFAGRWALPGGLVSVDESLEQAAERELRSKTGLVDLYLEQLQTFGAPERDPRARVVSTAYFALLPRRRPPRPTDKYADAGWFPVADTPPLAYDHDEMLATAAARLRSKLAYTNIAYGLLPREFTLAELQALYEIVLGQRLDRRNFRRKILATGLLRERPGKRRGAHRPATLYAFARRTPTVVDIL